MPMKTNIIEHHEEDTPLDVFNYNVKKLQDATTQTVVVISDDLLKASEKTFADFELALARPHHAHRMNHLGCTVVGVNATEEQFGDAIRYYGTQETTKGKAQYKQLRKGWLRMTENNNGRGGMGFFKFLLPPLGFTRETFLDSLRPRPNFSADVEYIHPSGLVDTLILFASDEERLEELKFKTQLTHIAKVHELSGTVVSDADPDKLGRVRIRVQWLQDDVPDDQLPWVMAHVPEASVIEQKVATFSIPLVGTTVRVYLTFNGEDGYVMTYAQTLLRENSNEVAVQ